MPDPTPQPQPRADEGEPMTDDEIAEVRERHSRVESFDGTYTFCAVSGTKPWPCEVASVLAAYDAAVARADEATREREREAKNCQHWFEQSMRDIDAANKMLIDLDRERQRADAAEQRAAEAQRRCDMAVRGYDLAEAALSRSEAHRARLEERAFEAARLGLQIAGEKHSTSCPCTVHRMIRVLEREPAAAPDTAAAAPEQADRTTPGTMTWVDGDGEIHTAIVTHALDCDWNRCEGDCAPSAAALEQADREGKAS